MVGQQHCCWESLRDYSFVKLKLQPSQTELLSRSVADSFFCFQQTYYTMTKVNRMKKKDLFFSCLLLMLTITVNILAQEGSDADLKAGRNRPQSSYEEFLSLYDKREVMIPMRDGVRLFTSIYEPKDKSVAHPILMNRTPYGSGPYGEKLMDLSRPAWKPYSDAGYIIVFQDVRGKNASEGTFEDLRPFIVDKQGPSAIDEASDTYDTVEWLTHHTHNNGCVGVFGISYPGFYSTMAGLCGHPAVKAVSPQAPVTDWFRGDDTHHNGALFPLDMFSFEYWFEHVNRPAFWNGDYDMSRHIDPTDIIHHDAYTDYLDRGSIRNFTRLLGDSCRFWTDMVAHPDLDAWWEERNVAYHCQEMAPAVLVVGGLFDAEDCFGAFTTYRAIQRQSPQTELYFVEGPWSHGEWSRGASGHLGDIWFGNDANYDYYLKNIEVPFFRYYLEGKGEKPDYGAMVFHTGENRWHKYRQWEPSHSPTPFYLNSDGTLGDVRYSEEPTSYTSDPSRPVPFMERPLRSRPAEYMTSDQRFASTRPDVAVFSTGMLTDSLCLAGPVEADLSVAISSTDADFIVKLIDVFPADFAYPDSVKAKTGRHLMSGYQMLVRGEVLRGKYRNCLELDSVAFHTQKQSAMKGYRFHPSAPEPFVPGEVTQVRFRLPDVAHTFLPGHRLMIQVQSTWFPLVDRNPQTFCNIYECSDNDFRPCKVEIHNSEKHPSRIWLPVVY